MSTAILPLPVPDVGTFAAAAELSIHAYAGPAECSTRNTRTDIGPRTLPLRLRDLDSTQRRDEFTTRPWSGAMPSRGGADTDGSADHTDRPQSAAEAEGGCGPLQPGSRVDAAGRYCDVLLRGCCSRESVGGDKRLGGRPVPSGAEVPTSSIRVGSVQK